MSLEPGQKVRVGNSPTVYRLQEIVERSFPAGRRRVANLGPIPGHPGGEIRLHVPLYELTIITDTEGDTES